jgi:hypothetical protein
LDGVAGRLQPVGQPIPIEGGFHGHAFGQAWAIGFQCRQHDLEIVGQALLKHPLVVLVDHAVEPVIAMQVHCGVQILLDRHGLSFGLLFHSSFVLAFPHRAIELGAIVTNLGERSHQKHLDDYQTITLHITRLAGPLQGEK